MPPSPICCKSCSAACGSPCSMADRMRVTSFMVGIGVEEEIRHGQSINGNRAGRQGTSRSTRFFSTWEAPRGDRRIVDLDNRPPTSPELQKVGNYMLNTLSSLRLPVIVSVMLEKNRSFPEPPSSTDEPP